MGSVTNHEVELTAARNTFFDSLLILVCLNQSGTFGEGYSSNKTDSIDHP
jgi:hypothetical protein